MAARLQSRCSWGRVKKAFSILNQEAAAWYVSFGKVIMSLWSRVDWSGKNKVKKLIMQKWKQALFFSLAHSIWRNFQITEKTASGRKIENIKEERCSEKGFLDTGVTLPQTCNKINSNDQWISVDQPHWRYFLNCFWEHMSVCCVLSAIRELP